MSISKRLRYEILRRDNHTCRYCGASAPDVKLHVDHVLAVSLGGTDEAGNLVAACADCNSGKSATPVSAALLADVQDAAIRHAAVVQAAYAVLVERIELSEAYENEVYANYGYEPPDDWRVSVGRWFRMGVPVEIPNNAAEVATSKVWYRGFDRWKYLCGIVWNQIAAVDALAAEKTALAGAFYTADSLEKFEIDAWKRGWDSGNSDRAEPMEAQNGRTYTHLEVDDIKQLSYNEGYSVAYQDTWNQVHERYPGLLDGAYAT